MPLEVWVGVMYRLLGGVTWPILEMQQSGRRALANDSPGVEAWVWLLLKEQVRQESGKPETWEGKVYAVGVG